MRSEDNRHRASGYTGGIGCRQLGQDTPVARGDVAPNTRQRDLHSSGRERRLSRPLCRAIARRISIIADTAGRGGFLHAFYSPADFFLLGVDLRKNPEMIEQAYNDSQGVTARFNKNMLNVINTRLGADFDTSMFDHNAVYNAVEHRIEMRLISRGEQEVSIPEIGRLKFGDGESIVTELSYKYDRDLATELLTRSGLRLREWFTDETQLFALVLASH